MDIEKILTDNRSSQAAIGVTRKVFKKLLPFFDQALEKCTRPNPYRGGRPDKLKTGQEKLFFVLYFLKNYPTYDVLGMQFGLHRSCAYRKVTRLLEALSVALRESGFAPAVSIEELNKRLKEINLVIVDGTEQRKNRPKNKEKQRDYYSGKKNTIQ
jgi:hypothetical protein